MIEAYDDVLIDPNAVRTMVLDHIGDFNEVKAFDGEAYKRVFPYHLKDIDVALEELYGPIAMLGSGFRLNFGNELPNNAIHVDEGWGTHALVLYLSQAPLEVMLNGTGTAFWEGNGLIKPEFPSRIVDEKFNRMVVYNSNIPHSRWPFEAYGSKPENGRLIYVAFFNIINQMENF